jgi:S-adenosylmethionine/arginine decarboxylase-like enzyme
MTVHSYPERGVLLLDVVATTTHADAQRAVDVFARRIGTRPRTAQHPRG